MAIVDIVAILALLLGAFLGYKKGAISSLVHLIGLLAIVIVAYQFKDKLADIFIKYLPFFNFGGNLKDLYALNFLLYEGVAFIVIFVLLYCLLNILLNLSGFIDLLLKVTIIFDLPSKIVGAILGAVQAIIYIFVISFTLLTIGQTQGVVMDSTISRGIVERTPIVNMVFRTGIGAAENVYLSVEKYKPGEEGKMMEVNLEIIRSLIKYEVVSSGLVNECINNGKLRMENVVVAS